MKQGNGSVDIVDINTAKVRNPLQSFEALVERNRDRSASPQDRERIAKLMLISILTMAGHNVEDANVEQSALNLLDDSALIQKKTLVVGCFLRLLQEPNTHWLSQPPWRSKIAAFFDSELEDLYRDRKIESHWMAHQKIEKLTSIVKEFDQSLLEAFSMLTSLDQISAQRHKVLRALRNKPAQRFIVPFLPDDFLAQLLEAYKRAEIYVERRGDLGIVDILDATNEEIRELVQRFEAKGTLYSKMLAEQVGRKLLSLISEDFGSNAAAQPAEVVIETLDSKKYPLHLANQTISLGFVVRNQGPGYAYETKLSLLSDASIRLSTEEVQVGRLAPTTSQLVEIPAQVLQAESVVNIYTQIDWHNFDHTQHSSSFPFVAQAQRSDIDWRQLEQSDPYSLEPVTTAHDLVGRRDLLNRLLATLKAKTIGSSIIRGQKRVGKTSIARTIQSYLEREGYLVAYLESGDYVEASPAATVARLGNRLCKEMTILEPRLGYLHAPKFEDALSPLAEFLDDITRIVPERRMVFILDEFDELPLDLYSRGPIGDSFFLTLRSISSRPQVGFLLVGSEKITHVMETQADKLNKWNVVPVDYFTRESDWSDYRELVQRPVSDTLEYSEPALFSLHNLTAGNPYFTKLLCQRVFRMAVSNRDCHVTTTEINQAVETALRETDRNTFQHFWEDGIFERGVRAAEKSIRRRRILISISDVVASQLPASKTRIAEHPLVRDISTLESDLKEFVTRQVLIRNVQDETYNFKVPLFFDWLKERGVEDVIATFSDLDAALIDRQQEEEIKVHSEEIQKLINKWGSYGGQVVTEDKVRAWLEQFVGVRRQRAMFALLKGLRFYTDAFVSRRMVEVHDVVRRGTVHHIEHGRTKRSDILVSYLDDPPKSGPHLARLYIEAAGIYVDNVVENSRLAEALEERGNIQLLLLLDDFVATGKTAADYLTGVDSAIADIVRQRKIKVVFATVAGYSDGWKHIEGCARNLNMPVQLHLCETLDETAKCFSEQSSIFSDPTERTFAKEVALSYGKVLEKNCPLGFGNLEMAVVFERSCPNSSLPILWSESTTPKWTPLFKRL